jgi:hypothetical protein
MNAERKATNAAWLKTNQPRGNAHQNVPSPRDRRLQATNKARLAPARSKARGA